MSKEVVMFVRFPSVLRNEAGEGDGGGDGPAADSTEPTDKELAKAKAKEPEQLGKPKTVGDLKAKSFAERAKDATAATEKMLREKREAKAAAKAEPKDDNDDKPELKAATKDEPSDKADKAAKAIEKAGGDAPDQKKDETDKQYEARLVKALQDLRGAETQHKAQKSRADAAEAKAAQLEKEKAAFEKRLARAKTPEERLEFMADEMDCTLEQLIKDINDNKTRPPGQRAKLDPAVQAELEAIKAENARLAKLAQDREEKEKAEAQQRTFGEHVGQATKWLKDNAAEFPLLQAIPWAAKNIVNGAYQNGGDMGEPARKLQQSILEDFAPLLDHDDAWKLLDGKLSATAKEKLQKRFGTVAKAAAVVTVPEHTRKPPSRVSTEVAVPEKESKSMSAAERRAKGVRAMQGFLDKRNAG